MAENKKGFILYCDLIHTIEQLPNEKAGELFKHILRYVNDQNPITDDLITNITFEPIKQQLKRDLKQWEESISNKSISGKLGNLKRWNNDLYLQVLDKTITIEAAEIIANNRKVSHTDKVQSQSIAKIAVTDKVIVKDTVIVKEKKEIKKAVAFDFSFVANNFLECFMKWVEYKKELKQAYKTQTSLQTCYNNLLKLSAGNPIKAMHVVNQSIGNGWAGLFEFKGQIEPEDKTDMFFANGEWRKKTPMQNYK